MSRPHPLVVALDRPIRRLGLQAAELQHEPHGGTEHEGRERSGAGEEQCLRAHLADPHVGVGHRVEPPHLEQGGRQPADRPPDDEHGRDGEQDALTDFVAFEERDRDESSGRGRWHGETIRDRPAQVAFAAVEPARPTLSWVILTMGDRPEALDAAIGSLLERCGPETHVIVVSNGAGPLACGERPGVSVVELASNVGIPAGRNAGAEHVVTDLVGFLDDDARLLDRVDAVLDEFAADPRLAVAALRLVDEEGITARRHVPRPGQRAADSGGAVAVFLGGACVLRASSFRAVGAYFGALWYGHEEVELSWRLVDAGWRLRYFADVTVFHPRTPIERHATGWEHTGRNRVMIARRTLPWSVALVHVSAWLLAGLVRAPTFQSRRDYLRGWCRGWRMPVDRRPIRWTAVVELTRLGRPPVV